MADKTIEIPEIRLAQLVVTVEGVTPLIVNRFSEAVMGAIEGEQQGGARAKKPPRNPVLEFQDKIYILTENPRTYGVRAVAVKKALVYAGGRYTDEQMTVLRGVINIPGDFLQVTGSEPAMRSDRVVLKGGTSSIAYRPQFMPWEIAVPVLYMTNMLTQAQVVNLFQFAGFSIGIGDWRPEKNGTFGQFKIKAVQEVGGPA